MAKKNRKCSTCGTEYSYCPNCDRNAPSWMAGFHTENCKNIFQLCIQYNVGLLTKEEAQVALNACDLSHKENFTECIQRDFKNIFAEEPKKRSKKAEVVHDEATHEGVTESDKAL